MANFDVDEKLKALDGPALTDFDAARARTRLRDRSRITHTRRVWATAAACVVLAALPAGGRVWKHLLEMRTAEPTDRAQAVDFALRDSSGKLVRLSDYRGQVVLLNFWATWCVPCQREVPWFIDFTARFKDRGFTVLGVSLDEEGWEPVRAFMAEKRINYPVTLATPAELPSPYNSIGMLPKTLLIDRQGNVAGEYDGLASQFAYEQWILPVLDR